MSCCRGICLDLKNILGELKMSQLPPGLPEFGANSSSFISMSISFQIGIATPSEE